MKSSTDENLEALFQARYGYLLKGGPGSGKRGHHTDRKPYPGEAAKPKTPEKPKELRTLQFHELPDDHYTIPNVTKYKKLLRTLGPAMEGHFTYDAKTDSIIALTDEAMGMVRAAIERAKKVTPGA